LDLQLVLEEARVCWLDYGTKNLQMSKWGQ